MNEIWFYTFSTSAQVLAALAGLFSIFVVFKLQSFGSPFDDTKSAIIQILSKASRNYQIKNEKYSEIFLWNKKKILNVFESILKHHNDLEPKDKKISGSYFSTFLAMYLNLDNETYEIFSVMIKTIDKILMKLFWIISINLISIGYCVTCLTFSDYLSANFYIICLIINLTLMFINLLAIGIGTITVAKV
ncbi:MAG TPA: hypothetical protein VHA78_05940 [Candidatus Peribacteraceae bacterium]|nr:hypothetical protein [Candidatus Peribacteraceae bacterium]